MNTESEFDRLASIDFFANVGKSQLTVLDTVEHQAVSSWSEAVTLRGSTAAADAFLEAANRLTEVLSSDYRKEYRQWNKIAERNRLLLEQKLLPRIDEVIDNTPSLGEITDGRQLVKLSIRWDFLHYAAALAFSQFVPLGLHGHMIRIYELGHFPCNWNEKWPHATIWYY